MKLLVLCVTDRSKSNIALNILKFLIKKNEYLTVCVVDKNLEIQKYLKKKILRI